MDTEIMILRRVEELTELVQTLIKKVNAISSKLDIPTEEEMNEIQRQLELDHHRANRYRLCKKFLEWVRYHRECSLNVKADNVVHVKGWSRYDTGELEEQLEGGLTYKMTVDLPRDDFGNPTIILYKPDGKFFMQILDLSPIFDAYMGKFLTIVGFECEV